jgi:hypothetical protein
MPLAAIFGQEGDQAPRPLDVDGIEDVSLDPPGSEPAGALQMGEVMRQRGRRHSYPLGDLARRKAFRPLAYEQPEHRQAMLLGEGSEGFHSNFAFHNSTLLKLS